MSLALPGLTNSISAIFPSFPSPVSTFTSRKPTELLRDGSTFSVPARLQIPKQWPAAAVKANYHAAAFAELLGLSERQLLRQCHRRLNYSTKALLTKLQMLAAAELLQEIPLGKDVGAQLGFQDPSSFRRRFKAHFGVTPWEFAHLMHDPVLA